MYQTHLLRNNESKFEIFHSLCYYYTDKIRSTQGSANDGLYRNSIICRQGRSVAQCPHIRVFYGRDGLACFMPFTDAEHNGQYAKKRIGQGLIDFVELNLSIPAVAGGGKEHSADDGALSGSPGRCLRCGGNAEA